jgi:soluble lytic murein transglycosylase-like protein
VKGVPVIKEQQLVPIPNSQGTHVCMPSDYRQNIDCGVAYLSELFRKARNEQWPRYWKGTGLPDYGEEVFDGFDFVIMAYNAGETRIRRFLRGKARSPSFRNSQLSREGTQRI